MDGNGITTVSRFAKDGRTGVIYMDRPGLEDCARRVQAAKEIGRALNTARDCTR